MRTDCKARVHRKGREGRRGDGKAQTRLYKVKRAPNKVKPPPYFLRFFVPRSDAVSLHEARPDCDPLRPAEPIPRPLTEAVTKNDAAIKVRPPRYSKSLCLLLTCAVRRRGAAWD